MFVLLFRNLTFSLHSSKILDQNGDFVILVFFTELRVIKIIRIQGRLKQRVDSSLSEILTNLTLATE